MSIVRYRYGKPPIRWSKTLKHLLQQGQWLTTRSDLRIQRKWRASDRRTALSSVQWIQLCTSTLSCLDWCHSLMEFRRWHLPYHWLG